MFTQTYTFHATARWDKSDALTEQVEAETQQEAERKARKAAYAWFGRFYTMHYVHGPKRRTRRTHAHNPPSLQALVRQCKKWARNN